MSERRDRPGEAGSHGVRGVADAGSHGVRDVADAGVFLARLTRLDPAALVRLRAVPGGAGRAPARIALWGRLPWQALVTRTVAGVGPSDATVSAAELLSVLRRGGDELPARRDASWRWPLPSAGRVVEAIAAEDLLRIDAAAAGTLRAVATRQRVGERVLRDALLDHVAIVVTGGDAGRVDVSQRLVQAVLRMGFLGPGAGQAIEPVRVCVAPHWTGLAAPYGIAWLRRVNNVTLLSLPVHTNG